MKTLLTPLAAAVLLVGIASCSKTAMPEPVQMTPVSQTNDRSPEYLRNAKMRQSTPRQYVNRDTVAPPPISAF